MPQKQNLMRAHDELFRRGPDEIFPSLQALYEFCRGEKERSDDHWRPPADLAPHSNGSLRLGLGEGSAPYRMNDWSFTQLCGLAGVSKETVNRLSPGTARRVLEETLPQGNKPLQVFTTSGNGEGDLIRSIHGTTYTRLHNADLVTMLREFAVDFIPPQKAGAINPGGTGLYCGERDLFAFLIDPTGWAEIDGEAFAPGFFVWNSEVGCRSVGISTFWFQGCCANHIVWDATEVVEFTRKHTGKVGEALGDIRRIVERLVAAPRRATGRLRRGHQEGDGDQARRRRRGGDEGADQGGDRPGARQAGARPRRDEGHFHGVLRGRRAHPACRGVRVRG